MHEIQEWNPFPKLSTVYLSVKGECCDYWKTAFIQTSVLETLFLELKTSDNWPIYCSFLLPAIKTLKRVDLYEIEREPIFQYRRVRYISVDVSVFSHCRNLTSLGLSFSNDEYGSRYEVQNLGKLPKNISNLKVAWAILNSCDVFNLGLYHRNLRSLEISYWSSSNYHFAKVLCHLKWLFRLRAIKLTQLLITDSKLRFQNRRRSVRFFINSLPSRKGELIDSDQTYIIFNKNPPQKPPELPDWNKSTSVMLCLIFYCNNMYLYFCFGNLESKFILNEDKTPCVILFIMWNT